MNLFHQQMREMGLAFSKKNKNMELIQLNKFSSLHNNTDIFFCKTDFLREDLNYISTLDNNVILISGNSDYPITDDYLNLVPKNIIKWYGQNITSNHELFEPIPLGIENKFESQRVGHGVGYFDRVHEKEFLLNRNLEIKPTKKIYANFEISTNYSHRVSVKNLCVESEHIDWETPNLSLQDFFDKILDYEMVVCPAGNGVDTHRLWEVLYSRRVPITIKMGNFKIYELYEKLPIIILDNPLDLYNYELINKKYSEVIDSNYNIELLDYNYWNNKISKFIKQ